MKNISLSGLYEQVLYENNMKFLVDENFYSTIKEYYQLSGNYKEDSKNINELHSYIFEDDFDPLGHGGHDIETPDEEVDDICVLSISKGNKKLDWPYLSLPAGYTCPMATVCKNFAAKPGTKFSDGTSLKGGPEREFMCYAARQQAQYSRTAGKAAFSNLQLLQEAGKAGGIDAMADLIINSIQHHGFNTSKVFRIHEGGDFFSSDYMKAWIKVANHFTSTIFYTHTTSINFWLSNKGSIPRNMKLIASVDKNNEELIMKNNLRFAKVVYSVEEAQELGIKIDYDDSIAAFEDESFALLIHGQQPAGSDAGKAVSRNRKTGVEKKIKALHKANSNNRKKQLYNQ
tara:strand:- start:5528 stop:6559 length:1032 start_codon:yes stop_codon:yes gene_type:complete